jgi:hypothetical protein
VKNTGEQESLSLLPNGLNARMRFQIADM